jgi:hypothetical protein
MDLDQKFHAEFPTFDGSDEDSDSEQEGEVFQATSQRRSSVW